MGNLVIVEASGKAESIRAKLRAIGLSAEVIPTVGHVADNPKRLRPIALDEALRETSYEYRPERAALIEKIQRAAFRADRIFIAADDDQEGDAIAYDVSRFLTPYADRLYRVRLRAITEGELKESFSGELSQEFEAPARNAMCRRIVDRAIGATFTKSGDYNAVPVGRVQSALLCHIDSQAPTVGHFHAAVRLSDGQTYLAQLPVNSKDSLAQAEAVAKALADGRAQVVGSAEAQVAVSRPWSYEDVVGEAALRLRLGIDEAAQAFQEAYERGRVSYPRIRAAAFTPDAVEVAARIAANNRCGFDPSILPLRSGGGEDSQAHEAPGPVDEELLLGRPLSVLDLPDAVAVLVARNVIECGQKARVRKVDIVVEGTPLSVSRVIEQPRACWKRPLPERGYVAMPREVALLRYVAEAGLGRPSTVVSHVQKFLQRGLLEDGIGISLNERGKRWLDYAKSVGFSVESSTRIEAAMAGPIDDAHARARDILKEHGMLSAVQGVVRAAQVAAPDDACPEPF
ncbi:DNA topoisomerase [Ralstonia sp. ASV6]|uniref:DNA topoisomerase n=1 Tax=Ralstonia sp. ASV6 TaxID=2795124 RepID=UPI0018EDBDEB|nr:DNA topoisomerase [Ralstonia sp. ASV6]